MTDILALDIATTLGWARGRVGGEPTCGSVRFAKPGASQLAICGAALKWAIDTVRDPLPDLVAIEDLLPPAATKGRRNVDHDLLAHLHGLIMGVCFMRGVYKVRKHSVNSVRSHFLHGIPHARGEGKACTITKAKSLGWLESDDGDAADALALWSYQCGLLDGNQAVRISPLFSRVRAIA
jgi:hypothetical protein